VCRKQYTIITTVSDVSNINKISNLLA
jgi:hypothetical protein